MSAISVGGDNASLHRNGKHETATAHLFSLDLPDDESALAIANRIAGSGLRTVNVFDDEGNRVGERAIRPPKAVDPEDTIRRN
jgi:hypothetical protein